MKDFHKRKRSQLKRKDRKGSGKRLLVVRSLILISLLLLIVTGVVFSFWLYRTSNEIFPVREVVFYGNTHLSDGELRMMAGIDKNAGILRLSANGVSEKLLKSQWIKDISIRKELPYRILIKILEASPFAILELKGRSFLIDEKGRMLEEIKGSVPFLPIITADPFRNRDNFMEALHLARVLRDRKIATERGRVEIIADKGPEGISMVLDNVVIKIGCGDYEQKLQRLFQLEDEIRRRAIAVDYVDLRFANRVVVKPINEVVR